MLGLLFVVVVVLISAGFLAWLVTVLPFIAPPLKQIVQGVILFVALIFLLYTLYGYFVGRPPSLGEPQHHSRA